MTMKTRARKTMIERLLRANADTFTREKRIAAAFSAFVIGAVLWPVTQNWRKEPKDSFPLSHYPMFSLKRADATTVRYLVGVGARGERQLLPHTYAGTGGLNQVRRQINKVVRGGKADSLCRTVVAKVAQEDEKRFAGVVTVQIVTGRYRLTDYFTAKRKPVRERVNASCPVERNRRTPLWPAEDSA
jgi:hypothetical protein